MADDNQHSRPAEPRGLGEHARGLASEYAHEQGWGLEEERRTTLPESPQDTDGGSNYEYGARDFGDEPTNADRFADPSAAPSKDQPEEADTTTIPRES